MADPVRIEGYREFTRLGAGGFATVYRAYQERFDRIVAVKVLNQTLDERALRRFERECQATGRLSGHPNVVTVLDSGLTADGMAYMTTELMERGSLGDWIEQHGAMPLADVLQIGVKMCGALTDVHEAGILHRDLKPPNILVSKYGEPALADFGISAVGFADATGNTTSFTPQHTPPEVLEGQSPAITMDVYSLGSTLYHLLNGSPAFDMATNEALLPFIMRVLNEDVPSLPADVAPPEVSAVLAKAMAKKPEDRYQSAEEMGRALQGLQARLGYPVTPMAATGSGSGDEARSDSTIPSLLLPTFQPTLSPTVSVTNEPARRNGLLIGAAVLVVVVLAAAGLALSRRSGNDVTAGGPGGDGQSSATTPNPAAPVPGGRIVAGLPTESPKNVSPLKGGINPVNLQLQAALFDPLMRTRGDGFEPVLAESVEPDEGFTHWTVRTRPGVTVHDGSAFDASAVKQNIDAYRGAIVSAPTLRPISNVEVVDERTVRVDMASPWAVFPATLSLMLMVAPSALASDDPVGTGPFKAKGKPSPTTYTLERNPGYWQGRAFVDEIEFRFLPDNQERLAAFDRGELDLAFISDPSVLARQSQQSPTLVEQAASLDYLVLNTTKAPLDDPRVREALSLATDRTTLAGTGGMSVPLEGFVHRTSPYFVDGNSPAFDPKRAAELIAAYKADKNVPSVEVNLSTVLNGDVARLGALLKQMWGDVGVTVTPNAVEADALGKSVIVGNGVAALSSFPAPLDPDHLYIYFHSDTNTALSLNLSRVNDTQIDAAVDTARSTQDRAVRRDAYSTVTRRLSATWGYLFLVADPFGMVVSRRVTGIKPELAAHLIRGGDTRWCLTLGIER
jgi:ABC-type transport system substrate-binding protein